MCMLNACLLSGSTAAVAQVSDHTGSVLWNGRSGWPCWSMGGDWTRSVMDVSLDCRLCEPSVVRCRGSARQHRDLSRDGIQPQLIPGTDHRGAVANVDDGR